MMLQIGVGYAPRTLRPLQTQPSQGLMLVLASEDASLEVSAKSTIVEVTAPAARAGSYSVALADLERGPVCLVAPVIKETPAGLTVDQGLWAYDASRGTAAFTLQWLVQGAAIKDATGLTFAPTQTVAAQTVVVAEAARQNGIETTSLSAPFTLPAKAAPEAVRLSVAEDATLNLVADPAGTATVEIVEPKTYAGKHAVSAAMLKDGPLWLVPARIEGTAKPGGTLVILYRGLYASDADAGPARLQSQWQRNGAPIPGATADTYQVQAADVGRTITLLETATDSRGASARSSNEIAIGGTS